MPTRLRRINEHVAAAAAAATTVARRWRFNGRSFATDTARYVAADADANENNKQKRETRRPADVMCGGRAAVPPTAARAIAAECIPAGCIRNAIPGRTFGVSDGKISRGKQIKQTSRLYCGRSHAIFSNRVFSKDRKKKTERARQRLSFARDLKKSGRKKKKTKQNRTQCTRVAKKKICKL